MSDTLSGPQKSALILLALERDQATHVLRLLPQPVIERIIPHMVKPAEVSPDEHEALLGQTADALDAVSRLDEGGAQYTEDLLSQALGPHRAALLMRQLSSGWTDQPFRILLQADPDQAAAVLAQEHPQLIALMLNHVPAAVAASLLSRMPDNIAADTTRRLAHLGHVDPSVLHSLEAVLESKLMVTVSTDVMGGVDRIVPILNASEPSVERAILDRLSTIDPDLASQVRDQLFTFEDLRGLDDVLLQNILRRIPTRQLAMALRNASHELRDKIYANMTGEMSELLQDEIETLGAQKVRDVEAAQHAITSLIHELEDAGEIELPHGEQEAVV